MSIYSIYNRIVSIHPRIEIAFRKFYWNNYKTIKRFRSKLLKKSNEDFKSVDLQKIHNYLQFKGIRKGDLIVVHSSNDFLKRTGITPKSINNELLSFIGKEGTLAMPVFRVFKDELTPIEAYNASSIDKELTYNVNKTPIWTGLLSRELIHCDGVQISRFPLNPMASVGKLAKPMMENNLAGDVLLPHGPNSSWKFCIDNNAEIIGIGINLVHSLTIVHAIEDCQYPNWPIKNWYNERIFNIIDGNFEKKVKVLERKAIWGMCYDAEVNLRKDLIKNKILTTQVVEGIPIEIVNSNVLYQFLQRMNKKKPGYPYYVPKKFLRS